MNDKLLLDDFKNKIIKFYTPPPADPIYKELARITIYKYQDIEFAGFILNDVKCLKSATSDLTIEGKNSLLENICKNIAPAFGSDPISIAKKFWSDSEKYSDIK